MDIKKKKKKKRRQKAGQQKHVTYIHDYLEVLKY